MKQGAAIIAILLALSACNALVALPPAAEQDAPMTLSPAQVQTLHPGDRIKLTVYGEETLSNEYTINSEGFISLPLLGDVIARGLSKQALQDEIARRLKKEGYLNAPIVTVDAIALRPVFVMGEVRNPGKYDWGPSFTVFQAIASAGGYTPRAAQDKALISRNGKVMNAGEKTPVLPGDSVTVRERIF